MRNTDNKIIGKRIYLREMEEADAQLIVIWRNDPDINKNMFKNKKLTLEDHLIWFRNRSNNRYDYMICDINTNLAIGTVNFTVQDSFAESGRLLGNKNYLGKGYAKEAAFLWLWYGFEKLKLEKIIAKVRKENVTNIELNKKLGFKIVSEFQHRDSTYYIQMELTKSEYTKNKEA
ncbi:MAG: GNAT family N-acetyltransferase [Candidatus Muirbacterium halophilum]|nr:GNAT family N-acetyltransferase [Candidatus Muirbacterium halophilum]